MHERIKEHGRHTACSKPVLCHFITQQCEGTVVVVLWFLGSDCLARIQWVLAQFLFYLHILSQGLGTRSQYRWGKTAENSFQGLWSPRNSTWTTHDTFYTNPSHLTGVHYMERALKVANIDKLFPLRAIDNDFISLVPWAFEKQLSDSA